MTCDFCRKVYETIDEVPLCHYCYFMFADPNSKYFHPEFVTHDFHGVKEKVL